MKQTANLADMTQPYAPKDEKTLIFPLSPAGDEIVARRGESVKHFDLGGGRYQMVVYPEPVHFMRDGKWEEYDNHFTPAEDANGRPVLMNGDGPLCVALAQESRPGQPLVWLEREKRTMSWSLKHMQDGCQAEILMADEDGEYANSADMDETDAVHPDAVKAGSGTEDNAPTRNRRKSQPSQVRYQDIQPDIDVVYTLMGNRLKEDIMIHSSEAARRVILDLSGDYLYARDKDGSIRVLGRDGGETPFAFATPVAYDAEDRELSVDTILIGSQLRYAIPEVELQTAAYPITLDPVVTQKDDITARPLKKGSAGQAGYSYPVSGRTKDGKEYATFVIANTLSDSMRRSDTVISAYLKFKKRSGSSNYVAAYEVLSKVNTGTSNWNTFKSSDAGKPENAMLDPAMLDCKKVAGTVALDITRAYRNWKTTGKNYGILLRAPHVGVSKNTFIKLTKPQFIVNYVSHAGIAGWWQYEDQAAGRAGTAKVDLFNGNLVLEHPDMAMNGSRMPIGVAHYYNSCLSVGNAESPNPKESNNFHCGVGFKLSAQQCVSIRPAGKTLYYVWTDGTGLEHWFKKRSSGKKSNDLEGMKYELVYKKGPDKITITDTSHTVMTFVRKTTNTAPWNNYWLSTVCDSIRRENNIFNKNTYEYKMPPDTADSEQICAYEGMVSKITDSAQRTVSFDYDENLRLSRIHWNGESLGDSTFATRYLDYAYDDDGRLIGVNYYDLPEPEVVEPEPEPGTDSGEGGDEGEGESTVSSYHTSYEYENNLLTAAINFDGKRIQLSYDNEQIDDGHQCNCGCPYCCGGTGDTARVSAMEFLAARSDAQTLHGAKQTFEYDKLRTIVTAVTDATSDSGKALTYLFNNSGNVVSVQDELGFAQFTEFSNQVANQVKGESKLQRVVINRLGQFGVADVWQNTGVGNAVIGFNKTTNNIRLLGVPSAKLEANAQIAETVTLRRGKTYTASVYACTQAQDNNSQAVLRVKEGDTILACDIADVELMSVKSSGNNNQVIPDEWARMSVTFELPSGTGDTEITVELANEGTQLAWFALPQLETGEIANHVNLLYNADFTKGYTVADGNPTFASAWKGYDKLKPNADSRVTSVPSDFPPVLDGNCLKITGSLNKSKRKVVQEIPIVGGKNTVFTLGGWAKGISLPGDNGKKPYFDLAISFKEKNGKYNDKKVSYLSFNKAQQGWQYACRAVIAPYPFTAVRVECVFSQNVEYGLFSNLFLSREEFGTSFVYDNDKNVVSVQNRASQKSKIKYDDARNIKAYRKPGKTEKADYTANYGNSKQKRRQHQPEWEQTPEGVRTIYGYDKFGNVISTGIQNKNHLGTSNPIIGAKKEFSEDYDGLFETKQIDARGMTVTRDVDPNLGRVNSVTDPANTEVCYQYDASDRVTEVSCQPDGVNGPVYRNTYTYENDRIATVTHNTDADETHDVTYSFDYDALGRKTTVKVGSQELSKNIYGDDRPGLLKEVQYGNGGRVRYEHDDFDRPTGVYYDDEAEPRYRYKYDAEGRIAKVIDTHLARTAWTEYDLSGRPIRMSQTEANEDGAQQLFYRTHLNYNKDNSLKVFKETVGTGSASTKHSTSYTYDKDDRTTRIDVDSSQNGQSVSYDGLGRITGTTVKVANSNTLTTGYAYEEGDRINSGYGSQATTNLVKTITQTLPNNDAVTLTYSYDNRGNITSVRRQRTGNTAEDKTTEYVYDAIGQLIRVNDPYETSLELPTGTTWTYQYDMGGNILSKSWYNLVAGNEPLGTALGTTLYGYNTSSWRDRLDSYNGMPMAYDEIGNLTRFGNKTYEWSAGRQLKRMTIRGTSGSGGTRLSAEDGYDADSGTTLRIEFDNGNALTEDVPVSTASVHVYQDGMDVTDEFVDAAFEWQRDSGDETADAQWAADHKGVKEIQLARTEVSSDTRFSCTLKAADDSATQPVYGTVSAMPGLSATHTPAEADAEHVFRVENGALVLDIPEITEENTTEPPLDIEDDDEAFDSPTIDAGDFEIVDEPDDESGDITEPDADDPEIPDDDPDVDDTPDAEYDPEAEENEPDNDDAIIIPTGINYVLEDGVLKADAGGISQDITASAMVYTGSPDTVIEFSYDRNGLRTQKKVITATGTVTTNYILHGKLVTHQTVTTEPVNGTATREDLHFYYDAQSRPMMVKWNGQFYTYVHNLQGDIVAIVDSVGNKVVEYRYDAWGRDIGRTLTSDIGKLNPFRYRGYVYDEETGLYYLRSRYYDAGVGRFICADTLLGEAQELIAHNSYAYCKNNPTHFIDTNGSLPQAIIDKRVHNNVLKEICDKDTTKALTWKGTCIYYNRRNIWGGFGYCDLYNKQTGEVWELKKKSNSYSCLTTTALVQLGRYISGRLKNDRELELTIPSKTVIHEGSFSYFDPLDGYNYNVHYWSENNGILRYEYTSQKSEKRESIERSISDGVKTVFTIGIGSLLLGLTGDPGFALGFAY